MNNSNHMLRASGILVTITMLLMLLAGCNNNNMPNDTMNPSPDLSSTPTSTLPQTPSQTPSPTQIGETKTFSDGGLKLEVTNVYEVRTESMNDDGGNPWEYSVFVCYPSASVTVLTAGMSDVTITADGKSHANWGVLLASGGRKEIMDNMNSFHVTSDTLGIYNLESSMYVLKLEIYKNDK
ncbi:hypothetical protein [Paenibacillus sp. MMS20-IR301]|uniref:hypothetical protein n=1 Tax=Paenibacillus sp. MMS20-IR301 TaxID=2895946 RepID=UPI0028EAC440|nr:hypothetical protein [Paenibacillus sp. MMS20-IR301]WNS46246.1 hypothetical protein LOS79_13560 [Paenibacillus sp. MMS20-IR301]